MPGQRVETRRVNPYTSIYRSGCIWRLIADENPAFGRMSAQRVSYPQAAPGAGASAVRADRLPKLDAADAPEGGGEKQGQAADRRVGDERGPERGGQGEAGCHGEDTCEGRNQYQTCQHVARPLHVRPAKTRGAAWQDYGRAWVNLRQVARSPRLEDNPGRIAGRPGRGAAATCRARPAQDRRGCAIPGLSRLSFVTAAPHDRQRADPGDGR